MEGPPPPKRDHHRALFHPAAAFSDNREHISASGTAAQEAENETEDELDNINAPAQKATSKSGSGKPTKKPRGERKGTTVIYSELFEKHKEDGWGSFNKTMAARKISQKLGDGDIVDDKTNENFKNLFKIINDKFK